MEALEIRRPRVMLFEIDLTATVQYRTEHARTYRLISRYPGVIRDLAFLVDQATPSGRIERIIREFPAIAESSLVDVYTGEQVPQGKKSLAFYIVWQSPTRTLTDTEVEIAQNQLLEVLERETGATLRS
jgi:phenylalanyl-tRNA synthetase beta chain